MGFIKTNDEIAKAYRETGEFYDAEMLTVVWETRQDVVRRLLPPPLKPTERPLAVAFVANYPKTNFGVTYLEGALFLRAEFDGEKGLYCLGMPVTNDMALALGREVFGYPKKIARIELKHNGKDVEGWAERHGVRFFEIRSKLTGKFNIEGTQNIFSEILSSNGDTVVVTYNFKHFPSPDGGGFDFNPRLVREEVEFRPNLIDAGEAEIVLKPSDFDPWAEVEIVKVLGSIYTKGNNIMRKGKVVAEADAAAFAPYAFLKWDM
jgi:acetoacetate decarboxylase